MTKKDQHASLYGQNSPAYLMLANKHDNGGRKSSLPKTIWALMKNYSRKTNEIKYGWTSARIQIVKLANNLFIHIFGDLTNTKRQLILEENVNEINSTF